MRRATVSTALVLALLTLSAAARTSDPASAAEGGSVASAQPFFVNGAVDAHLASPAQRVPADAYFEDGYRLLSWNFLAAVVVMWMLLRFSWSGCATWRSASAASTRCRPLLGAIRCAGQDHQVPIDDVRRLFRERQYDLSNQTFGAWMRHQEIGVVLIVLLGALFLQLLFGLVRRLSQKLVSGGRGGVAGVSRILRGFSSFPSLTNAPRWKIRGSRIRF